MSASAICTSPETLQAKSTLWGLATLRMAGLIYLESSGLQHSRLGFCRKAARNEPIHKIPKHLLHVAHTKLITSMLFPRLSLASSTIREW